MPIMCGGAWPLYGPVRGGCERCSSFLQLPGWGGGRECSLPSPEDEGGVGGRLAGANTGTGAESAALLVAEDAVRAMVRGCCSTRDASLISSRDLGAQAGFVGGAKAASVEGAKAA